MLLKVATSLLIAAVTGIFGWAVAIDREQTRQKETTNAVVDHINTIEDYGRIEREDIKRRLDRIQGDITEIRRDVREMRHGD